MSLPPHLERYPELDTWIRIDREATVTLFTGKVELGQAIVNAIARIGAEELDLSIDLVRVETADTLRPHDEGLTAGSDSLKQSGTALRQAAAEARVHLLELAADRLGVAVAELTARDGVISAAGSGARTTYWELLGGRPFNRRATGSIAVKAPSEHRLVGRPGPRIDLRGLVTGSTRFVQDLQEPNMVHARVVRPPSPGARLVSLDASRVSDMPGVLAVVQDGSFIGVVAEREEQSIRAREALIARARWSEQETLPGHWALDDWLLAQPTTSFLVLDGMPVYGPIAPPDPMPAGRCVEATFSRPFQMHASIGPSAAMAQWSGDDLRVWSHSQGVHVLRESLAQVLGVDARSVRVSHVVGPGCYGHNGADDAALDAALLARAAPGRPVLLKWMRADEHAWEPYGAPAVVKVRAGVDDAGRLAHWDLEAWSTTHNARPFPAENGSRLLAAWHRADPMPAPPAEPLLIPEAGIHRNATPAYSVPRRRIVKHLIVDPPLRTSSTRALGAYVNVMAIESVIDELAAAAGTDPLAFRLAHLDDPRARAVVETAAERAGWSERGRANGRGMGIGYARYKNSAAYAAVVIELRVDDETAAIVLERAVIAADAGEIVDPSGLVNQLEGGLIQSASWTLKEQVRFDRTRVTSVDWDSYPILTFREIPAIETVLLDQPGEPYLGSGEATHGPTVAAIANAVFAASAIRIRTLPFTPEQMRSAALG